MSEAPPIRRLPYIVLTIAVAAATAGVTALLINISERKAEGATPSCVSRR